MKKMIFLMFIHDAIRFGERIPLISNLREKYDLNHPLNFDFDEKKVSLSYGSATWSK